MFEGVPLPSRDEVAAWMTEAGFSRSEEIEGIFPQRNKWVMVYGRK